ncbi:formylglycine-generating enzyme family protein [Myxococcota bacterium]|nr:formylglycine-generating enzyme family protein [Myxococcota bacterium]
MEPGSKSLLERAAHVATIVALPVAVMGTMYARQQVLMQQPPAPVPSVVVESQQSKVTRQQAPTVEFPPPPMKPPPGEQEPPVELSPVTSRGCHIKPTGGTSGSTYIFTIRDTPMTFVLLDEGQFCMGSPEGVGGDDERPQHAVKVSAFLIGKSEVTQAQWRAVVSAAKAANDVDVAALDEDHSEFEGDRLPVDSASWCDVTRFANALSRLNGRTPVYEIKPVDELLGDCSVRWVAGANGYRLPTEAEWEYAARAGTTTAYATGDDEAALARAGWYGAWDDKNVGNSGSRTHEVCTAPEKPWGLCDLHGNVWEWVFDVYDEKAYSGRAPGLNVNPGRLSDSGGWAELAAASDHRLPRVFRGGSWRNRSQHARSAARSAHKPFWREWEQGFRLVLSVSERP